MTCKTCPFFYQLPEAEKTGECRRNPPVTHIEPYVMADGNKGMRPVSRFPWIDNDRWCGEHPERTQVMTAEIQST